MNQMNEHVMFAQSLNGWATIPPAAVECVETWQAAIGTLAESPVNNLRADAYNGTLNPQNLLQRLNEAGAIVAAQHVAPQLVKELDGPLAQRFANAVRADADRIVAELGEHFDKYAAHFAKYAPLVPAGATADDLLASANTDVLAAWQNLGVAETTLDQVAYFRAQLTTRYDYPAPTPEITAWIAPVKHGDDIRCAAVIWRGHRYVGAIDSGTVPLLEARGGRWRHLIEAGFELHCNTASEAAAVGAVLAPVAA